jgi:hypothetical protein
MHVLDGRQFCVDRATSRAARSIGANAMYAIYLPIQQA